MVGRKRSASRASGSVISTSIARPVSPPSTPDQSEIPSASLKEGIRWEWESFPEFLDAIGKRKYAIDIGAQIPHAALRTYVMGKRGAAIIEARGLKLGHQVNDLVFRRRDGRDFSEEGKAAGGR